MSLETAQWLNLNTLIGNTSKRGTAWHYREELQGDENNHYPSFIPAADVRRRLFDWQPYEMDLTGSLLTVDGVANIEVPDHKAIYRHGHGTIAVVGKDRFIHEYDLTLLATAGAILEVSDGQLQISSAGLLRKGAVAWVEFSTGEVKKYGDFAWMENLLAGTSLDSSMKTTYKLTQIATVCDNTFNMALGGKSPEYKVSHRSALDEALSIEDARGVLGFIEGSTFEQELKRLLDEKVSQMRLEKFLDAYTGLDKPKESMSKGAWTKADTFKGKLFDLATKDEMCAPWLGTAWGVVQTVSTFFHNHQRTQGGTDRGERNTTRALSSLTAKQDARTLAVLATV